MNGTKERPAGAFDGPLPGGGRPKVKVMRKDRLEPAEKVGLIEAVKGMAFTFKEMLKPRATIKFPEEKMPRYPSGKGQPVLVQNDDGTVRCVACGLCEFVCPAKAIYIDCGHSEGPIQREPEGFKLDVIRCILCGMCEEACPKEAIVMSDRLLMAGDDRDSFLMEKEDLLVPASKLEKRLTYTRRIYSKWNRPS